MITNELRTEITNRVNWIKTVLSDANAKGVVLGGSGGKDSVLVSILCRMATPYVTSIIMPCQSKRNFEEDKEHALLINEKYDIKTEIVDLTSAKEVLTDLLTPISDKKNDMAFANINPRLRMITLYNYAQREGYLVAGTGNRSEITMGYFTKWGDGASDFNPIADLTVTEIYKMLYFLDCPEVIIDKAPSAGLYEGQTDEQDMGISYKAIDKYLLTGEATEKDKRIIETALDRNAHKRALGKVYRN